MNKKTIKMLKTARGQIDGILKMIEEKRYCIDISNQIMATNGLLSSANNEILTNHLHTCLMNATDDREQKINELSIILKKLTK